jgi:hypothetical protein
MKEGNIKRKKLKSVMGRFNLKELIRTHAMQ